MEQSGALRSFQKMDVELMRPIQGSYQPLRMEVQVDKATRRVAPNFNYALHPGDYVTITQDSSTVVDEMIDSALSPLGPFIGSWF